MNKTTYTKLFLKQLGETISDQNVQSVKHLWWYNTRDKNEGGLRLTEEGLDVLNRLEIATYEIPFPLHMTLTTQIIIFLDKFIDCPYYLTNRSIIVTMEKKAVELTLFSGDLRKYGLTKAMTRQKKDDEAS